MSLSIATEELVTLVRESLDEFNTDDVTDAQIIRTLNRAQRNATNIIAREFEDALLASTTTTTVGGQQDYAMPADALAARVERLELIVGGNPYPISRVRFDKGGRWESNTSTARPVKWAQVGPRTMRLYPTPSGGQTVRVWYSKLPDKIVKSQGRIEAIDPSLLYVDVDTVGSDLTAADALTSYVNIVDAQTGEVKVSLQVTSLGANRITFEASPTRTTVLDKTIAGAVTSDVEIDDYVCLVPGTCVPQVYPVFYDYLLEYAVVTIKRALGEAGPDDYTALNILEKELSRMWVGRESTLTVTRRSGRWSRGQLHRRLLLN